MLVSLQMKVRSRYLLAVCGLNLACRIVGALLSPVNPTDVWVSLLNQSLFGVPFLETDLQTLLQKSECMWGMKNLTESLDSWGN